jgi:hypothetical protein
MLLFLISDNRAVDVNCRSTVEVAMLSVRTLRAKFEVSSLWNVVKSSEKGPLLRVRNVDITATSHNFTWDRSSKRAESSEVQMIACAVMAQRKSMEIRVTERGIHPCRAIRSQTEFELSANQRKESSARQVITVTLVMRSVVRFNHPRREHIESGRGATGFGTF